jgi:hypothetical protein
MLFTLMFTHDAPDGTAIVTGMRSVTSEYDAKARGCVLLSLNVAVALMM